MRLFSHSIVKACFCGIVFTTVIFIMIITRVRVQYRQYWCDWPDTAESRRREKFCLYMESYFEEVCRCDDPVPINFVPKPIFYNQLHSTPVAIVGTDRAHSLYRTLRALLSAPGAKPSMITVFLDGLYSGPIFVAQLLNIRIESHTMDLASPNDLYNVPEEKKRKMLKERIDQHYKFSLDRVFELFPTAEQAIILEDDLHVSPDFFSYFNQTYHLLHEDESLYCISAWNDFSYKYSSRDPTLLYRVDTMPGLGWMLTRKLYEELKPKWLSKSEPLTWDGWIREPAQRKGRECIMPDVCRTFHFTTGVHISEYQQRRYFNTHSFNDQTNLHLLRTEDLTKDAYEETMNVLVDQATPVNHNSTICDKSLIPDGEDQTYVIYIEADSTLINLMHCLKLWDVDIRPGHNNSWRFWRGSNHVVVVQCPESIYCKHKPEEIPLMKYVPPKRRTRNHRVPR